MDAYVSLLAGEAVADKLLNVLDIVQLSKRLRVYAVLTKVEGSLELKEALKRLEDQKKVSADSIRHTEVKKLAAKAKLNKSLELQMRSPRMRSSPSKKGGAAVAAIEG